ncbi:unnamed protein product, partial [Polarella glacialis]
PSGQLEQILVDPSRTGIAVLTKMLPLKKRHDLPEDMRIFRADGKELEMDRPLMLQ